ncbi:MAG: hypothetical protein ACREM9_08430 [Gemmatimonadales bacterium]
MRHHRWAARVGRSLVLGITATLWLSCGGGGELTAPTTGAIEVTTSTSGTEPDPDGYTLTLDDVEVQPIGVAASAMLAELAPGTHRIGLSGVSPNCTVSGGNPRTVTVAAGETAAEAMAVVCAPPPPATGGVSVTTSTSGVASDPDGYSVTVDGDAGRPIAVNGNVTVADVEAGDRVIGLAGVAANCTVAGDNPRTATVLAGAVVAVDFSVACAAPPPAAGTITVTTLTNGPSGDPDGYAFAIGGGADQPIGASGTVSVANVAAGATTVALTGVASNCAVGGQNPRDVTVPAGGSVEVAFAITCAAGTGSLEIVTTSTGSPSDPSGYTVSVDGASGLAIGVNATRLIEELTPGPHSVALGGVAGNCAVQGQNPRSVTVAAGQTGTLTFTVECSATTGSLAITIAGLPGGVNAAVTVTGPGNYREQLTATETLGGLTPGDYTVSAASVSSGGTTYSSDPEDRTAAVEAGATAQVAVTYTRGSGPSLNLRIAGLNLTQSVQTFSNDVPLVAERDALLRVAALANESNRVTPSVRVRLYDGGVLVETFTIPAPADTVQTGRTDGDLGTTWNRLIPGSRIRPGLAVLADVDPTDLIAEADETDNTYRAGQPQALSVRTAPPLAITLVPVRQSANQLEGDVSAANRDGYLDFAQRIHPLPGYDADVHQVYTTTTSAPLQSDDANGAWNTILSEMNLLRVAEDDGRDYYGVVRTGYTSGIAGMGFIGIPAAIGYDRPGDRGRIAAHELGHTWGRDHAPCGNPAGIDPDFPYPGGSIGRIGYDIVAGAVKPRSTPDVMGYCGDPWISDYTYQGVMNFRGTAPGQASAARAQPVLLVWGRVVHGRAMLEPAFQVVTRPVLPARPGAWAIEGTAANGSRVFGLSFDPIEVADDARGSRHFAFAVPIDPRMSSALESIRLTGPGVGLAAVSRAPASLRAAPAEPAEVVRVGGGLALRWDAAAHPMVMVRDRRTGEVLSLARGGNVRLPADGSEVELVMSDGVRSSSAVVRAR